MQLHCADTGSCCHNARRTGQASYQGLFCLHRWQSFSRNQKRVPRVAASATVPPDPACSEQWDTIRASTADLHDDHKLSSNIGLLRSMLNASTAAEAADIHAEQCVGQQHRSFTAADCEVLLRNSLAAGNVELAISVYQQMCSTLRAQGEPRELCCSVWPSATVQHTQALVVGLCRLLRVSEALSVISSIKSQGLPATDEVTFGHVVNSPLPPQQPLAVVQAQEGCKLVLDSNSRYEFELFSGTVTSCSSQALQSTGNLLQSAARAIGILRRQPAAAVHELVVSAPDGSSRTFRVGTATADVPAQLGERVTVVCAPGKGKNRLRRILFSTSAPGTQPSEPLMLSNHKTGVELQLVRAPLPGREAGLPSWLLPAAVVLAGGDAASGLINPSLPLLILGSLAAIGGSAVASNTLLLPQLKQAPPSAVKVESIRQQLLAQYAKLGDKNKETMQAAGEDVRTLARLSALRLKMQTIGGSGAGYQARLDRVAAAAAGIEERLSKRLKLLDGYTRVINMIEIEVEMNLQVPQAEYESIGVELEKLSELETVRQEWQMQAEAQDEVERLLRAPL
eukprot:GHRR01008755.1.p2 GENE.GHRR01008755.1~~GHRR01008755.1.p2  ORF type:complete len:567 (+),score=195.61 GHRR01008755.1:328-2028(+)